MWSAHTIVGPFFCKQKCFKCCVCLRAFYVVITVVWSRNIRNPFYNLLRTIIIQYSHFALLVTHHWRTVIGSIRHLPERGGRRITHVHQRYNQQIIYFVQRFHRIQQYENVFCHTFYDVLERNMMKNIKVFLSAMWLNNTTPRENVYILNLWNQKYHTF